MPGGCEGIINGQYEDKIVLYLKYLFDEPAHEFI